VLFPVIFVLLTCINSTPGPPGYPVEDIVTVSDTSNAPDTISEPVISAFPLCDPSHSEDTPVKLLPSPAKLPEKLDPDIAKVSVRSTIAAVPDTISEPVISASPLCVPFHSSPDRFEPSP